MGGRADNRTPELIGAIPHQGFVFLFRYTCRYILPEHFVGINSKTRVFVLSLSIDIYDRNRLIVQSTMLSSVISLIAGISYRPTS
jgi:hypothetical protein